jgi:pimeloyl-ACP methyl ester carboxylesterase
MGSWIALNLFSIFKEKIKGFIGIASAPEFLENLMWKKFSPKIKNKIINKKIYYLEHGEFTYPLTKQLIFDGKIFNKKINFKTNIVLFHGTKDEVVPISFSKRILKIFKRSRKKLIKIKNGDHRLSKKNNLKKICSELEKMLKSLNFH